MHLHIRAHYSNINDRIVLYEKQRAHVQTFRAMKPPLIHRGRFLHSSFQQILTDVAWLRHLKHINRMELNRLEPFWFCSLNGYADADLPMNGLFVFPTCYIMVLKTVVRPKMSIPNSSAVVVAPFFDLSFFFNHLHLNPVEFVVHSNSIVIKHRETLRLALAAPNIYGWFSTHTIRSAGLMAAPEMKKHRTNTLQLCLIKHFMIYENDDSRMGSTRSRRQGLSL